MNDLKLTDAEQRVMDTTLEVMGAIRDLYGGHNPCNFVEEGIPAIHILQQFARQHWAHRIAPKSWSNWTEDGKD
jgi:hypothetical protein